MANYVDATTQTIWAGLAKRPSLRPDILFTAPDTTTPPDDMMTEKPHSLGQLSSAVQSLLYSPSVSTTSTAQEKLTLAERRKSRPGLVARISLPSSELGDEVLPSPPPTHAILSPLPEANKRHAGHTPLIPRALSPVQAVEEQSAQEAPAQEDRLTTPDGDKALSGPLVLPTNPVDGAEDLIALEALDDELSKIAREQDRFSKLRDAPEPTQAQQTADGLSLSRKGSAESHKSSEDVETVDGVRLKSPPLNFGVPFGQAPRRRSETEDSAA